MNDKIKRTIVENCCSPHSQERQAGLETRASTSRRELNLHPRPLKGAYKGQGASPRSTNNKRQVSHFRGDLSFIKER